MSGEQIWPIARNVYSWIFIISMRSRNQLGNMGDVDKHGNAFKSAG